MSVIMCTLTTSALALVAVCTAYCALQIVIYITYTLEYRVMVVIRRGPAVERYVMKISGYSHVIPKKDEINVCD